MNITQSYAVKRNTDIGELKNAYTILIRKHERKKPLGRHRRGRKNNTQKCILKEIGCDDMNCNHLTQDRDSVAPL
jgi:hypothetical protein